MKPVPHEPALPAGELHRLDDELRQIRATLQRAGVKFGTGQLSPEGYTEFTRSLKERRAVLEAEIVRIRAASWKF